MLVADYLNIPFAYVRPEPKKHGRKNQIEGHLEPNSNVVVIEDLISTGKSSLMAVEALKNSEMNVKGMLAIFTYGFETADQNFEKSGVQLHTLSDYSHLLIQARDSSYITEQQQETLENWRKDPANWS